ncbi:hypothetical protein J9978_21125 [Chromobacterium violaceum]|nr:hypothetical protein [Chromobacterium violaceum]MBP4051982.1 hypothetical protein [Chromobacterium violaceum]
MSYKKEENFPDVGQLLIRLRPDGRLIIEEWGSSSKAWEALARMLRNNP